MSPCEKDRTKNQLERLRVSIAHTAALNCILIFVLIYAIYKLCDERPHWMFMHFYFDTLADLFADLLTDIRLLAVFTACCLASCTFYKLCKQYQILRENIRLLNLVQYPSEDVWPPAPLNGK